MEDDELYDQFDDQNEDDGMVEIEHVVMPDYTDIIVICAQYGITDWYSVCQYNKIKNPFDIHVGDTIIIQVPEEDMNEDSESET